MMMSGALISYKTSALYKCLPWREMPTLGFKERYRQEHSPILPCIAEVESEKRCFPTMLLFPFMLLGLR